MLTQSTGSCLCARRECPPTPRNGHAASPCPSVVGLLLQATDEELKAAYRRLCVVFHPDKHTDAYHQEAATRSFRAINEAYEGTYRCLWVLRALGSVRP